MKNGEMNPNEELRKAQFFSKFSSRHSFVIRHSSFVISLLWLLPLSIQASTNDYSAVDAIFSAHCLDCHAGQDPEGQLVLENFESLMKGGELGAALVPDKSAESLLVKMVEGR